MEKRKIEIVIEEIEKTKKTIFFYLNLLLNEEDLSRRCFKRMEMYKKKFKLKKWEDQEDKESIEHSIWLLDGLVSEYTGKKYVLFNKINKFKKNLDILEKEKKHLEEIVYNKYVVEDKNAKKK